MGLRIFLSVLMLDFCINQAIKIMSEEKLSIEQWQQAEEEVHIESTVNTNARRPKHLLLLHGFEVNKDQTKGLEHLKVFISTLQGKTNVRDWHIWNINYDTLKPFKVNAQLIANAFKAKKMDFSNTVIVGYSMGGIVARQLITLGFPCKALITICTPHEGVMDQVALITNGVPGPMSIWKNSKDLIALNSNARDKSHRKRYYAYGVTFKDIVGNHNDDHVVSIDSALGLNLGAFARRNKILMQYSGGLVGAAPFAPHQDALKPAFFVHPMKRLISILQKFR